MRSSYLILIFSFLYFFKSYGQVTHQYVANRIIVEVTKQRKKIPAKVEVKSASSNIDSSRLKFFEVNITKRIQGIKKIKKGKYVLSVKFIVNKDGDLSDIACENDPGYEICQNVISVVKKSKSWTPATQIEYKIRN